MIKIDLDDVITACCFEMQYKHPRTPINAKELAGYVDQFYQRVRDIEIEVCAERIFARFGLKLIGWREQIWDRLAKTDQRCCDDWAASDLHGEDEDGARGVAIAMAVLFFYRAIDRGWVLYSFAMSEKEAAAWLAQNAWRISQNPAQPSLFATMGGA